MTRVLFKKNLKGWHITPTLPSHHPTKTMYKMGYTIKI